MDRSPRPRRKRARVDYVGSQTDGGCSNNDGADAPASANKKSTGAAPKEHESGARDVRDRRGRKNAPRPDEQAKLDERFNIDLKHAIEQSPQIVTSADVDRSTSSAVRSSKHKPFNDRDDGDGCSATEQAADARVIVVEDDDCIVVDDDDDCVVVDGNDCAATTSDRQPKRNRLLWLAKNLSDVTVISNSNRFRCPICLTDCEPGNGVTLRECVHEFCRACIKEYIEHSIEPSIKCPYMDDSYACSSALLDLEVKELAPSFYETYLQHSLSLAESQEPQSFHCKTPDCRGWCIYENGVNLFECPVCNKQNCLTCMVIHEGKNCKQYQDDLKARSATSKEARATEAYLKGLLKKWEAIKCPGCKVIIQKNSGCDLVTCSMCRMQICWATMKPRWGPKGIGDISGGCRCNVDNIRCHPKCRGCH